ncbi:SMI1/KNR4 family protein [Streptomyces sp. NPDC058175]|uniref:SMI1/KNR4 family protein n=1 Tax=Streptomyces sp. NPDC058175 TaxID=3346367 RepID=UPI0036ECE6F4
MEFGEFEARLAGVRAEREGAGLPEGFQLFDFQRASGVDLDRAEGELRVRLPEKYKEFMRQYGGGEFLYLDVLPAVSDGEDDLLSINQGELRQSNFIAIAPVGTGDWWGFVVVDGVCSEQVEFLDHEDGQLHFAASDVLDFLVREGLCAGKSN